MYRARSQPDLVFQHDLDELARARGIAIHYLTGPRVAERRSWLPQQLGHLTDSEALLRLAPHLRDSDVFVCGPDDWMDAACDAAEEAGLPAVQLHVERFTW